MLACDAAAGGGVGDDAGAEATGAAARASVAARLAGAKIMTAKMSRLAATMRADAGAAAPLIQGF